MTASTYQHDTRVDRAAGIFNYDCSGLMDYAIGIVRPGALTVLGRGPHGRPLAQDFEHYLASLANSTPSATWNVVPTVKMLEPGDIISWLATAASKTKDTGHVLVVMGAPYLDPNNPAEWLIPIADSTVTGHTADSRNAPNAVSPTGLGTGTIGLGVDATGHPVGFYWKGGKSALVSTAVALGSLK